MFTRYAILGTLLLTPLVHSETTDNLQVLKSVKNAVYEVVLKKPETDTLSYAEKLPHELLSFQQRNDKYYSIGSAFPINETEMITAWHVIVPGSGGLSNGYAIRDAEGKIYEIDKITGFSNRKDYLIFTLKDKKFKTWLKPAAKREVQQKIFAIGNALGEGIIARDGIFTSETPETYEGKWNYIRFTAAASPGNSGGPLVDAKGNFLGIVLRKSENENLNYALPSEIFINTKREGKIQYNLAYRFTNTILRDRSDYARDYSVPASFAEIDAKLIKANTELSQNLVKNFFNNHKKDYFPYGPGGIKILNNAGNSLFPMMVAQTDDGVWSHFEPEKKERVETEDNGLIVYGSLRGVYVQYMRTPRKIKPAQLMADQKQFLDLSLKHVRIERKFAGQKIRVTSFGQPAKSYTHADRYSRKWQISEYPIHYADEKMITYSSMVPDGIVTLIVRDSTGKIDMDLRFDMLELLNYMTFSYYGRLSDWKDFYQSTNYIPDEFKTHRLEFNDGKELKLQTREISSTLSGNDFKLSADSDMRMDFGFTLNGSELRYVHMDTMFGENVNTSTSLSVFRVSKPAAELPEAIHHGWGNIINQRLPFDRSVRYSDGKSSLNLVTPALFLKKGNDVDTAFYLRYVIDGKAEDAILKTKVERISTGIKLN